jgi:hypothetical protein
VAVDGERPRGIDEQLDLAEFRAHLLGGPRKAGLVVEVHGGRGLSMQGQQPPAARIGPELRAQGGADAAAATEDCGPVLRGQRVHAVIP